MIRTCDPLIRSQVLYPAELRVQKAELLDYKPSAKESSFRRVDFVGASIQNVGQLRGFILQNTPAECVR